MNLGHIPGYYFDQDKKKYFKVQADYKIPAYVKHARSNVDRERREKKRRHVEATSRRVRKAQTVTPAPSLKHPLLGGSGLLREQGCRSYGQSVASRDVAYIEGLTSHIRRVPIPGAAKESTRIVNARYLSDSDRLTMAVQHKGSGCVLLHCRFPHSWSAPPQDFSAVHAFHNEVVGMSTVHLSGEDYIVACTSAASYTSGNLFASRLPDVKHQGTTVDGEQAVIGCPGSQLWDIKLMSGTPNFAIVGTHAVSVSSLYDVKGSLGQYALGHGEESFAVDWLNHSTVAFGVRGKEKMYEGTSHTVSLWDLRSSGISSRIQHPLRITGIERTDEGDHSLLVSSSTDISLYDLRIMRSDRPLLSFSHVSAGPKLSFSSYRGVLAAVDEHDSVQFYSLRLGKQIRQINPTPKMAHGDRTKLQWYDDHGSGMATLQTCSGQNMQTWS